METLYNIIYVPLVTTRVIRDKIYEWCYDYDYNKNAIERIYKKDLYTEYSIFFSEPTEIYPRIYLGSAYNASEWNTLTKLNIRFIINVTAEITNYFEEYFEYYRISIKDNNTDSINEYFDESFNNIENFLQNNNGNILIHCFMGSSRSASIAMNYISKKENKEICKILNDLKQLRPSVNPSIRFMTDLNSQE